MKFHGNFTNIMNMIIEYCSQYKQYNILIAYEKNEMFNITLLHCHDDRRAALGSLVQRALKSLMTKKSKLVLETNQDDMAIDFDQDDMTMDFDDDQSIQVQKAHPISHIMTSPRTKPATTWVPVVCYPCLQVGKSIVLISNQSRLAHNKQVHQKMNLKLTYILNHQIFHFRRVELHTL